MSTPLKPRNDEPVAPQHSVRSQGSLLDRTWVRIVNLWRDVADNMTGTVDAALSGDGDVRRLRDQMQACLEARGGEVSARARAAALGHTYLGLDKLGRERFLRLLAGGFDADRKAIDAAVSALQAAAARAGAPLGHDFCAISLSDLLTPWAVIERRLEAAAKGDFVIALYNPASQRRRQGLANAIAILESSRPPTTPVIIARNLGRDGETVDVVELRNVDQNRIDMMSLIIIGSSQTRMRPRLHGRPFVYTPRGYLDDLGDKALTA